MGPIQTSSLVRLPPHVLSMITRLISVPDAIRLALLSGDSSIHSVLCLRGGLTEATWLDPYAQLTSSINWTSLAAFRQLTHLNIDTIKPVEPFNGWLALLPPTMLEITLIVPHPMNCFLRPVTRGDLAPASFSH